MERLRVLFQPKYLLLLLILFHLIGNLLWIYLNHVPPLWDEAGHTRGAFRYFNIVLDFLNGRVDWDYALTTIRDPGGPFVKGLTALLMVFLYPDVKLAQFVGTLFFLGSIIVVYELGKFISNNRYVGLMAAFFFSFFLNIYSRSRSLSLDIVLVFLFISGIYFIVKSDFFNKTKESIFFSLILSFSILTKIQAGWYWLLPLAYSLFEALRGYKNDINKRWRHLLYISIISLTLVMPWIIYNFGSIKAYFQIATKPEPGEPTNLSSFVTWLYYLKIIAYDLITIPGFIFLLSGLFFFVKSKKYIFFLTMIVGAYITFTIFPNKDDRYLYPLVPLMALISGHAYFLLKEHILTVFIFILFAFYQLFLYTSISFGYPFDPSFDIVKQKFNYTKIDYQQLINTLRSKVVNNTLVVLPNYQTFNFNTITMYAAFYNYRNDNIVQAGGRLKFGSAEELNNYLAAVKYFYYTDSSTGVPWQIDLEALEQMQTYVKKMVMAGKTEVLESFILPENNHQIYLLRRKD